MKNKIIAIAFPFGWKRLCDSLYASIWNTMARVSKMILVDLVLENCFSSKALLCFVSRSRVWNRIVFVVTDFMELSRYMYTWNINRWLKIILWFLKLFIHLKFIHLSHLHLTFMKIILCANTSKNYYILLKAIILSSSKMNILEHSGFDLDDTKLTYSPERSNFKNIFFPSFLFSSSITSVKSVSGNVTKIVCLHLKEKKNGQTFAIFTILLSRFVILLPISPLQKYY